MRFRSFLIAPICGALVGAAAAVIAWIQNVLFNDYLEYGMLRLTYHTLIEMWNPVVLGSVAIGVILWALSAFLLSQAGWSRRRVSRFAVLAAAIVIMLFAMDWALRTRTGFTLAHALSRITAKIAAFATGRIDLDQMKQTLAVNQKGAVLAAASLVVAVFVIWLMLRAPWERLLAAMEADSRHFHRAGLALAALTLSLNVIHAYDRWRNPPAGPSILIVVVDCLRPDHLGHYGYARDTSPNIDDLARGGTVFLDAYSNAPWTKPSIGTLFTSLYPDAHTAVSYIDVLPPGVMTLAEVLKNEGYFTVFLNSRNPFIIGRFGFHQGFDVAEDFVADGDAAQLTDRFLSLLADLHGKRYFAYLHYMDPHVPYSEHAFNEEFTTSTGSSEFRPGGVGPALVRRRTAEGGLSQEDKEHILGLYDGQIRYADHHLGRLFDRLKKAGPQERPLTILIADHGEEFWEHGNFEHGHTVYQELLRVPLIMSGCGLPGAAIEERTSLLNLMPTILDLAGVNCEHLTLQGVSLEPVVRGPSLPSRELPVYATGTLYGYERRCVISADNKLIVNTNDDTWKLELYGHMSANPTEVYNLRDDPGEQNDLSHSEPQIAGELKELISKFEGVHKLARGRRVIIDEELKRKLRSVGYLEN